MSAARCVSCYKQEEICSKQEQISYLLLAATSCTHLVSLYWLMVFIHETHVMPSSGQVKTKRHLFSYFVIAGSESCPMCQLLQTLTNYHITYMCLVLVAPIFWHYIDWWCLFMKHMWCHLVAKLKLKGICSHAWLFQVVCCPMCQLSKQEQITTLRTLVWYSLHPFCSIILTDGVYSWNTCDPI